MGDAGYGQQDPIDTSSDYGVLVFIIEQLMAQKYFTRVVKVVAVDTTAKTVDVQIATNQLDGKGNSSPHVTTFGIPYVGGQAGTVAFKIAPAVGDLGVMAVNDRDLSSVKAAKDIANPGSLRKFAAADGVYLWSIMNKADPVQFIEFSDEGVNIVAAHGNQLQSSASGWTFTGNVIMNNNLQLGGSIEAADGGEYAGDIRTTGDVVAGTVSLNSHLHSGVKAGGDDSGPPVP